MKGAQSLGGTGEGGTKLRGGEKNGVEWERNGEEGPTKRGGGANETGRRDQRNREEGPTKNESGWG